MSLRVKLKTFIFGKREFMGSHADFKSIMLCGQMGLVAFLVGVAYTVIDIVNHVKAFIPFYLILMVASAFVIVLLRTGFYKQAKIVLVVASNLLIYLFVTNDNFHAGVYMYFGVTSIMSLALFGYNEKKTAIIFCAISLSLFFLAYLDFKIFYFTENELSIMNNEEYAWVSFLSNFIIVFFTSCLIFYFLLDVNDYSEKQILTKNDELAKTNEELDRFVYSASHDLRAPLRSVLGLIGVAGHSQSKEELEQCLAMMKNRINNLDKFIGEIIDYSRNARQDVQKVPVDTLALCQHIVEELKFTQGLEELSVSYQIANGLIISTDPTRLKIILTNIIGNAMKYQDSDKAAHQIEIIAAQNEGSVQIEIKDNGIGISPEHHQRIFDMFYRASESGHGSGLGLYIVKETLAKLNGEIRFNSTPGIGTSFIITLPA